MISLKKIKFRLEKTKTSSIQNFYNNSELLANSKNGLDVYLFKTENQRKNMKQSPKFNETWKLLL